MLHHFPHQAIDGSWHAVYRIPGCDSLSSVGVGPSREAAQAIADKENELQARNNIDVPADYLDRPVPRGFYETEE